MEISFRADILKDTMIRYDVQTYRRLTVFKRVSDSLRLFDDNHGTLC